MLAIPTGVLVLLSAVVAALGRIRSARLLHRGMLSNIIRSPQSFFDVTPLGRVVNRFSKDVDMIDIVIPQTITTFAACLLSVAGTVIVISCSTPLILVLFVPLTVFYYVLQV